MPGDALLDKSLGVMGGALTTSLGHRLRHKGHRSQLTNSRLLTIDSANNQHDPCQYWCCGW